MEKICFLKRKNGVDSSFCVVYNIKTHDERRKALFHTVAEGGINMNTVWSDYIQGPRTLYYNRKLRFDNMFAGQYMPLFGIDPSGKADILEVGCGPGALAGALRRWYPNAAITALDRDSAFLDFARRHVDGVSFVEGDAKALPFGDASFDVTVSNTVSEHIEPSAFYGEQLRVLRPGGICLVLSSRRGISVSAESVNPGEYEQAFWKRVEPFDDTMKRYSVCRYPMNEAELPAAMERYGFSGVSTGFAVIPLTPDDPRYPPETARDMINSERFFQLESIESVDRTMPGRFSADELEEMKRLTNARYDRRLEQYARGEKQWDTDVSVIMVVRGFKRA